MGLTVRPAVRRRHLEAVYDGRTKDFFAGATADEYVALVQQRFPGASRRFAIENAGANGRPDLMGVSLAGEPEDPLDYETDLERVARTHRLVRAVKRGPVDLRTLMAGAPEALECVHGALTNFDALEGRRFVHLELRNCTAVPPRSLGGARALVGLLRLVFVETAVLQAVAAVTDALRLELQHDHPIDLVCFAEHGRLEAVSVSAPEVSGLCHLRAGGLSRLSVVGRSEDEDIRRLLSAAPRLEQLAIGGRSGFGPEWLPELPALQRISVPASNEHREAWIRYGEARPTVGFDFTRVPSASPPSRRPPAKKAGGKATTATKTKRRG